MGVKHRGEGFGPGNRYGDCTDPECDHNKKSGFEDDPESEWTKLCLNPSHEPPQHLVIPQGKIYRHICPGCGREVVMRPPSITL